MAASRGAMLLGRSVARLVARSAIRRPFGAQGILSMPQNVSRISLQQPERLTFRIYSTEAGKAEPTEQEASDTESRFKEKPWEYFESEEYIERYGSNPVWFGYRRNHKGQIPPQKTRKTCIRGKHVCGNPCPICRDPNLFVDYRNVKLLEQFISPQTGIAYHPTHTGICMKRYQQLTKAIQVARDSGLLSSSVPFATFQEDYSNRHPAVTKTPPSPALQNKTAWYEWYDWQQPPEKEVQRMRRIYKDYLKEESSPPVS